MRTILLLTISNIFMTFAWYGHLKYRNEALWKVIFASWGIFFNIVSGAREPHRLLRIQRGATKNHSGNHQILTVFPVFRVYLGDKFK
jgi:uncharacterized protein (DUF486 family)